MALLKVDSLQAVGTQRKNFQHYTKPICYDGGTNNQRRLTMAEKQVIVVKHRGCLHSCGNWLGLLLLLFGLIVYAIVNSIREENARIAEKQKAEAEQTAPAKESPETIRPVSVRGNAVD